MAGFQFTLLHFLAVCLQASEFRLLNLGPFTYKVWMTTAPSYGCGEAWWGIRCKASCKNTCFLAFCETHGKPLRPSGLRGLYFKNHLNRKWGTFPASFVSLQPQDAWRLWFLAFTLATFFFQPVFISARHPFISRHQVQATLWRSQIYSFSLKTLTFTPHGL